jgi:hypothetical protein
MPKKKGKKKMKKSKKHNLGRNPWNEELAANRAKYGRGGYAKSKKAYARKRKDGKSKRQQWFGHGDD